VIWRELWREGAQLLEARALGQIDGLPFGREHQQHTAPLPEPPEQHELACLGGRHRRMPATDERDARLRSAEQQRGTVADQQELRVRVGERAVEPIRLLTSLGAAIEIRTGKEGRTSQHG
jgi:hypothetical protein